MLDVYHATRDDVIRLILAQQAELADQARRLAALETYTASANASRSICPRC